MSTLLNFEDFLNKVQERDKKKLSKFSSGLQKQFLNELKKYLSQQKITETETSYVLQKKILVFGRWHCFLFISGLNLL